MGHETRSKSLTGDRRERFASHGFVAPIDVLSPAEIGACSEGLAELFAREARDGEAALRHKPHLRFTWVRDLVRHPCVLDAIEELLGPDLVVFRGTFFVKPAGDPATVPWHQDR